MDTYFLENIPTPIVILDVNKNVVKVNRAFYEIFGEIKTLDSIIKNPIFDGFVDKLIGKQEKNAVFSEVLKWNDKKSEKKYIFEIEISKVIPNGNKDFTNLLLLFKDISEQYLMVEKTLRRSEEISILLDISLSESQLKDHNDILATVGDKITQLTKFNYGMFLFYSTDQVIDEIKNFHFPEDIYESFHEKIINKQLSGDFKSIKKTQILKKNNIKNFEIFEPLLKLDPKEIILFPVDIYGVFLFCSNNPYVLRISEEANFFALLGQEVGRSLQRANLYHRLEHSRNELHIKNKTLNKQLELAQSIQNSIMTTQKRGDINIDYALKYIPSEFLSGDLYDLWSISENKTSVIIADVCGHGVSSALITAFIKATLKEILIDTASTGDIFTMLNNRLVDILPLDMYVSAFILIVDTEKKTFEYSSAGHPSQFYYNIKKDTLTETEHLGGTLLSIIPGIPFNSHIQKYNSGDKLILFTDGIYELRSEDGEIYGRKRFKNFVRNNIQLGNRELLESIVQNAYDVTKQNFLEDDVNLIVLTLK